MSNESDQLIAAANEAAKGGMARASGLSVALGLLVSWVMSIEARLKRLESV